MLARISFWVKGVGIGKIKATLDTDVDIEEVDLNAQELITRKVDNILADAIRHGLMDSICDSGIEDFGVLSVSFKKHRRKADYKY